MRTFAAIAACAALVKAQDFDWDAIFAADDVATASVPVVYVTAAGASATASATTATYDATSAIASISAAVATESDAPDNETTLAASATATAINTATLQIRAAAATTCVAQPTGVNIHPTEDSASAFLAYPYFSSVAVAAAVPTGYVQSFKNLNASNQAYGYMGYTLMDTFDTQACSDKCNAIDGCMSINVYFERDPSVDPNDSTCLNPSSTTQIKCVFWGGPVGADNALNFGQYRGNFQVVIAGSNGYVNKTISPSPGYNSPQDLGSATINAPLDCSNTDTYMGMRLFTTGPFDANKCAAVCSATSEYDRTHGFWQTCQFFTTYMLYKNKAAVGQYCAMYTKSWNATYATNTGYYYGSDHYTIGYSYSYTNTTNAGTSRYSCIDTSCSNSGLEWAYYNMTSDTQFSLSVKDAGLDPVPYKTKTPVYKSTTDHVGGWWWGWDESTTFYPKSVALSTYGAVLNHRGYFFARETGSYTFSVPSCDDVAMIWVGATAYTGYNEGNALFVAGRDDKGASATKYLTAGTYYPLRVLYGNTGGGPGSLYFQITSPSGVVLHKGDGTASKFLVQKSCDGTAPAFAAFGSES